MPPARSTLAASLEAIAGRRPLRAWDPEVADLPWGDPAFSERMLREHLDPSHDLASRRPSTIEAQVERLVDWLGLAPGAGLLDVTCGPGLVARAFAERGVRVTGVDVAPAAVRHARTFTAGLPCSFVEADVRELPVTAGAFDAAVYLYGQATVPHPTDLARILDRIRVALRPGAPLAVEVHEPAAIDRSAGTAWWIGVDDLWGDGRHLVLSEHAWDPDARATVERYHVLDEATGELAVFGVTERELSLDDIGAMLARAGFPTIEAHPAWDGLAVEGAGGWLVVVAR